MNRIHLHSKWLLAQWLKEGIIPRMCLVCPWPCEKQPVRRVACWMEPVTLDTSAHNSKLKDYKLIQWLQGHSNEAFLIFDFSVSTNMVITLWVFDTCTSPRVLLKTISTLTPRKQYYFYLTYLNFSWHTSTKISLIILVILKNSILLMFKCFSNKMNNSPKWFLTYPDSSSIVVSLIRAFPS